MNDMPICLYLARGGKISLTIEGPIRLYVDVASLRRLMRKAPERSNGVPVPDPIRRGMSGLANVTKNPLVRLALTKFVPFGGIAITAVSAVNSAMQLGQRKLAKLPRATALVQDALQNGPDGDSARAQVVAIKTRADNGDIVAQGQVRAMLSVIVTLGNMNKLARIGT